MESSLSRIIVPAIFRAAEAGRRVRPINRSFPTRILSYTSIQPPGLMLRLLRTLWRLRVDVIIDLEDSLWDIFSPEQTAANKAQARVNLLGLLEASAQILAGQPMSIRLNSPDGTEFRRDLEALSELTRPWRLDWILLPKTESWAQIAGAIDLIRSSGLAYGHIVPIIETRQGLMNLEAILRHGGQALSHVEFGHFDLYLEQAVWPFPNHDTAEFWESVAYVAGLAEAHGLSYCHTAYDQLRDEEGFRRIITRLGTLCRRPFTLVTLGPQQAGIGRQILDAGPAKTEAPLDPLLRRRAEDPAELAREIIRLYEENHRRHLSFAQDASGRFIPPHEYLAAKAFLKGRFD